MEKQENTPNLKNTHKDLYGMLMLANQRIDNVGTSMVWIFTVAVFFFCVSIHMRWFDSIFGIPFDRLRGFGVYALIALVAFLAFMTITEIIEANIYRELKPKILEKLKRNDMSVETLLADIADDDNLDEIREKLMDDKEIL